MKRLKVGRLKVGSWKLEVGSWKLEVGNCIYLIAPAILDVTFDFHAPIRRGRLSTLFMRGDLLVSRRGKESYK